MAVLAATVWFIPGWLRSEKPADGVLECVSNAFPAAQVEDLARGFGPDMETDALSVTGKLFGEEPCKVFYCNGQFSVMKHPFAGGGTFFAP